ncbi:MAG: hypothetical protein M5U27_00120 [Gaiella sp.]|nr:hypothetical protein [Gaiella sp.]
MTGKAREHEVRIMGLGLAALAVLATLLAVWFSASLGDRLRVPTQGTPVTQSSGGPLGLGVVEQR